MEKYEGADVVVSWTLLAPLLTLQGLVLAWLWHWFVVPFGLPGVTVPWAIGLCATVSVIVARTGKVDSEESMTSRVFRAALLYLFAWGIGALVHCMM